MKKITIENMSKKNILVKEVLLADSFYYRLKGLMGKKELKENEGLCLKPCKSVHTFFMKFNIDVLFVDNNDVVCGIVENLRPWQVSSYYRTSRYVIELKAGAIEKYKIELGDKINISSNTASELSLIL